MFKPAVLLLIVAVVAVAYGNAKPAAEEGCKIGGLTLKIGESKVAPIGECKKFTCVNATTTTALGCATFAPAKGCTKTDGDKTKAYPDCCPQQVCKK